jgi:hypothetical protein
MNDELLQGKSFVILCLQVPRLGNCAGAVNQGGKIGGRGEKGLCGGHLELRRLQVHVCRVRYGRRHLQQRC